MISVIMVASNFELPPDRVNFKGMKVHMFGFFREFQRKDPNWLYCPDSFALGRCRR
jgi:hypothetical protein